MENKEFYSIFPELGHEMFEEKIKKPMELYLEADSNVISMNALNTIIANTMEKYKLGEARFYENDLFSSPALEEEICYDDTMPPIYDDYNDDYVIFSPPTIEEKINYDMPPIFDDYGDENNNDSYFVEFAPTTINKNDYAFVESSNYFRVFYFRAPGSLALLTFTQPLNFSSLFPSLFSETLAFASTVGFRQFR